MGSRRLCVVGGVQVPLPLAGLAVAVVTLAAEGLDPGEAAHVHDRVLVPLSAEPTARSETQRDQIQAPQRASSIGSCERECTHDDVVAALEALVEQLGWQGERFFHAGAPDDASRLSREERETLLAFLRLL